MNKQTTLNKISSHLCHKLTLKKNEIWKLTIRSQSFQNYNFRFDVNALKPERLFNTIYQDNHITVIAQKRSKSFQMLCFIVQKKTRTSLGQEHRSFFTNSWNRGFRKVIKTRLKPQCFLSNDVSSIIIICWVGFSNIELEV